ncbi:MAG: hypothetical protein RQ930_02075 [Candidatus Aenigmarchaeota archaeon]|nr:hypothetical protein [Candidatus Aenigmarchaeota archaeon]
MRAILNGNIIFGLISIPVKLYSATQSRAISFNNLHSICHTKIKSKR